jgi:hypothetical protein
MLIKRTVSCSPHRIHQWENQRCITRYANHEAFPLIKQSSFKFNIPELREDNVGVTAYHIWCWNYAEKYGQNHETVYWHDQTQQIKGTTETRSTKFECTQMHKALLRSIPQIIFSTSFFALLWFLRYIFGHWFLKEHCYTSNPAVRLTSDRHHHMNQWSSLIFASN